MSEKSSYNPYYNGDAPPAYTSVASSSGDQVVVDMNTGLCQSESAAPPTGAEAIKAIYGGISGINILSEADTILLLDDSESMKTFGYWTLLQRCISHVGPVITAYDPNGVDLYCLNTRGPAPADLEKGVAAYGWTDLTDGISIDNIFNTVKPMGTTPIYAKLLHILTPYLARLARDPNNRPRPINILVVTDGVADDTEGVEELIGEVCGALDECGAPDNQIGLQFIQIADLQFAEQHIQSTAPPHQVQFLINKARDDMEASQAWLGELDDFLQSKNSAVTRDIVDTKDASKMAVGGYSPKNMVGVLVGALSSRHDRMKTRQ